MPPLAKIALVIIFIGLVFGFYLMNEDLFVVNRPDDATIKENLKPIYKHLTKPIGKEN